MAYKVPSNIGVALQMAQQSRDATNDVKMNGGMGPTYQDGVLKQRMAGSVFQDNGANAPFAQDANAKENKEYFTAFASRLSNSLADQQREMA